MRCTFGIYRTPALRERYFLDHLSRTIDYYSKKYDKVVIMGDFNLEPDDEPMKAFCDSYNLHNLVKEKTCFKGQPKCYDLILTNCKKSFQNTTVVTTGLSDFHKMTVTVLKTEYVEADPIQINYRNYKNYNHIKFSEHLSRELHNDVTSNNSYNNFQNILIRVLDVHAPIKKKYLRANNSPFMTNYCPIMWMYCQRKSNNIINRIHERALRIAYNDYISDFKTLIANDNSVTIHQRNIQALTLEIYKTLNNLNPTFMKEIFQLKELNYSTRIQNLVYPNPRTVSYGLESFGYKATQLWNKIPHEMKQSNITNFKNEIPKHCRNICNCNLCKSYIQNLGYIDNNVCQSWLVTHTLYYIFVHISF